MPSPGRVILVGAGPGDPGLITLKGRDALAAADVVVYDRLSNPALLEHAKAGAQFVYMGKEPETSGDYQEVINQALVDAAIAGKIVVRLKGGDPFVFGRGGEEMLALRSAGVACEVIPGITSAVAAPAYAGVPVSHRGAATSFTVVSGSEDPAKPGSSLDWDALAKTPGTLVLLMGVRRLTDIAAALTAGGRSADTPVSVTQWGTLPRQRTVTGTLADIATRIRDAEVGSPAVTVIGPVAGLRDSLRWFDTRPLFGQRILITRSRQQASALSALLAREGADPVELPTVEIAPVEDPFELDGCIGDAGSFDWVVFTSTNGVDSFFGRLASMGRDARALGGVHIAAIGPATARALAERGVVADFVPNVFTTDAVADGFRTFDLSGKRILLPHADIAPGTLAGGLRNQDADVREVTAYRTVVPREAAARARELLGSGTITVATFTSSSTVRNLVALLDGDTRPLDGIRIASIGPVTTRMAHEAGLRVDIEAREHTVPGLVQALREAAVPAATEGGG